LAIHPPDASVAFLNMFGKYQFNIQVSGISHLGACSGNLHSLFSLHGAGSKQISRVFIFHNTHTAIAFGRKIRMITKPGNIYSVCPGNFHYGIIGRALDSFAININGYPLTGHRSTVS
jgi:hypothetical protein